MKQPEIARKVKFQKPLFDERSPWRRYVGEFAKERKNDEVKAILESEQQCYAVFEALRQGSFVATTQLVANGGSIANFDKLNAERDKGGHLQIPNVNSCDFAFPIFDAKPPIEGEASEILVRKYDGKEGFVADSLPAVNGRVSGLPIPLCGKVRPAGPKGTDTDGAVILIDTSDPQNLVAYDYWQATTLDENGSRRTAGEIGNSIVEAGVVSRWPLNENALGAMVPEPRRRIASRASGLPYMGGLLVPEDLERLGLDPEANPEFEYAVNHALAFVLPQSRLLQNRFESPNLPPDFVFPASNLETSFGSANPYALASGQCIRLKKKGELRDKFGKYVNEAMLKPITRIFLNTLRDYGAYLVDGGLGFGFAAEDQTTAPLYLDVAEIKYLVGSDEPLSTQETAWQIVMTALNTDLRCNGVCFGVPQGDSDSFDFLHFNFEVITNPIVPSDIPRGG